jgi:alpha/beta hydrolase family protein
LCRLRDPRPSLDEHYKNHDGYVAAVKAAATKLVSDGFLLKEDAARLVGEAEKSDILN